MGLLSVSLSCVFEQDQQDKKKTTSTPPRLRDVTPSHITSLDDTPSEVRTLEALTSGHYTFGQFHLRNITPSELTPSDVSPSGHYTFGTLQLRKITPSTVSEDVRR